MFLIPKGFNSFITRSLPTFSLLKVPCHPKWILFLMGHLAWLLIKKSTNILLQLLKELFLSLLSLILFFINLPHLQTTNAHALLWHRQAALLPKYNWRISSIMIYNNHASHQGFPKNGVWECKFHKMLEPLVKYWAKISWEIVETNKMWISDWKNQKTLPFSILSLAWSCFPQAFIYDFSNDFFVSW